jgi:kynurenine formamidase
MTRAILRGLILALCVAGLSSIPVLAGQPFGNNWDKWGDDDQIGTINYITPDVIRNAASLVKQGKVFSLAIPLEAGKPGWPGRVFRHLMTRTGQGAGEGIGGNDDLAVIYLQVSTQWDGLPHIYYNGKMYGGHAVEKYVTSQGALRNDIDQLKDKMVTRGVLLDVARFKGVEHLERGYVITAEDLEQTAAKQGVDIKQGDCLMIRTGWINVLLGWKWPGRDPYKDGEPGLGLSAAKWVKDKNIACLATDSLAVEAMPFDPEALKAISTEGGKAFPIHVELIVNQGMIIGEIFYFEDLAKDCAADGVYEFMFVSPPLRVVGGVGTPINPQAIK